MQDYVPPALLLTTEDFGVDNTDCRSAPVSLRGEA